MTAAWWQMPNLVRKGEAASLLLGTTAPEAPCLGQRETAGAAAASGLKAGTGRPWQAKPSAPTLECMIHAQKCRSPAAGRGRRRAVPVSRPSDHFCREEPANIPQHANGAQGLRARQLTCWPPSSRGCCVSSRGSYFLCLLLAP